MLIIWLFLLSTFAWYTILLQYLKGCDHLHTKAAFTWNIQWRFSRIRKYSKLVLGLIIPYEYLPTLPLSALRLSPPNPAAYTFQNKCNSIISVGCIWCTLLVRLIRTLIARVPGIIYHIYRISPFTGTGIRPKMTQIYTCRILGQEATVKIGVPLPILTAGFRTNCKD